MDMGKRDACHRRGLGMKGSIPIPFSFRLIGNWGRRILKIFMDNHASVSAGNDLEHRCEVTKCWRIVNCSSYNRVWTDQQERKLGAVTGTLFSSEIMISMKEHKWQHLLFVATSKEWCMIVNFADLNLFAHDNFNIIDLVCIDSFMNVRICVEISVNGFDRRVIWIDSFMNVRICVEISVHRSTRQSISMDLDWVTVCMYNGDSSFEGIVGGLPTGVERQSVVNFWDSRWSGDFMNKESLWWSRFLVGIISDDLVVSCVIL